MRVPFTDLSRSMVAVRERVLAEWARSYDACELVGGPTVTRLEEALGRTLEVPHVVACANGTDALVMALRASGVGAGSKVALPNLTFWATYEAVVALGATPVLVDVDPNDLQLSAEELASAHAAHGLDAALFVHLYGWSSARLDEIRVFCTKEGLRLVEDGAQCFGVLVDGAPALSGAALGTLSFYPAKVLGGVMDGGAVTARDGGVAALVRALGNHGRVHHYEHAHAAYNSRMAALGAAYLLAQLDHAPSMLDDRRRAARYYRERLSRLEGVRVFGPPDGVTENGYLNVIAVDGMTGDEIASGLTRAGIGSGRVYPRTIIEQPAVGPETLAHGPLSCSRRIARDVVSLPLFSGIREDEQDAAVRALTSLVETRGAP